MASLIDAHRQREQELRERTADALKAPVDPNDPLGNGGVLRKSPNDLRMIMDRAIADRAARGGPPPVEMLRQALARAESAAEAALRLSERLCGGEGNRPTRGPLASAEGVIGEIEHIAGMISRLADTTNAAIERIEKRGGF